MVHLKKILLFSLTYCCYSLYILKRRSLFNVWRCLQKQCSGIFTRRFFTNQILFIICMSSTVQKKCRETVYIYFFYALADLQFKSKYAFKTRFYLHHPLFLTLKFFVCWMMLKIKAWLLFLSPQEFSIFYFLKENDAIKCGKKPYKIGNKPYWFVCTFLCMCI